MDRQSFTDRVAELFKSRPDTWIDAVELERIGGRFAWRTRCSNCRLRLGMDIRNRQRRQVDALGRRWTISEYAYFPKETVEIAAEACDNSGARTVLVTPTRPSPHQADMEAAPRG